MFLRQVAGLLRSLGAESRGRHEHAHAPQSSPTFIIQKLRKYLLDEHLMCVAEVEGSVDRITLATMVTPFVSKPDPSVAVTRITVHNSLPASRRPSTVHSNAAKRRVVSTPSIPSMSVSGSVPGSPAASGAADSELQEDDADTELVDDDDDDDDDDDEEDGESGSNEGSDEAAVTVVASVETNTVSMSAATPPRTSDSISATIIPQKLLQEPAGVEQAPAQAAVPATPPRPAVMQPAPLTDSATPVPPPRVVRPVVAMSMDAFVVPSVCPAAQVGAAAVVDTTPAPSQDPDNGDSPPRVVTSQLPPKQSPISRLIADTVVPKATSAIVFGVQFSLLELIEDIKVIADAMGEFSK